MSSGYTCSSCVPADPGEAAKEASVTRAQRLIALEESEAPGTRPM
jgi:hypothetical protein